MTTPEKLTANEILKKHGPAGWLVRRLQAYALLGWILFFVTLFILFLFVLVRAVTPQPVVAIDESGQVLGTLEYLHPSSRSDQELMAAGMRFTQFYLSLNSSSIFDDYAAAMNMMAPEFLAQTQKALKEDNYLARVMQAKTRSWIEFNQQGGMQVVARKDLFAQIRLRGNIIVEGNAGRIDKPFDITLETVAVARNTGNTAGIQIMSRRDN